MDESFVWGTCHADCAVSKGKPEMLKRRVFIAMDHAHHADDHIPEHDGALADPEAGLGKALKKAEEESGYIEAAWFRIYDLRYRAELVIKVGMCNREL